MASRIPSILLADLGSATTRVVLIERVAGEYRAVAQGQALSTTLPPWGDATLALKEASAQIEEVRKRRLLTEEGGLLPAENGGPESFWATASGAQPLQSLILCLAPERILKILPKAISSGYFGVEGVLDFRALRMEAEGMKGLFRVLSQTKVELILLVGGSDVAALDTVADTAKDLAALLAALPGSYLPRLLYLGHPQAKPELESILNRLARVEMVDNPPPNLEEEDLGGMAEAVERIWVEEKLLALPGLAPVSSWGQTSIQPTPRGFRGVVEYLAAREDKSVLGVDLGASTTTMVWSSKGESRFLCEEIGLGRGLTNLLSGRDLSRITRWLPSSFSSQEVEEGLRNKSLRPQTLPQTEKELLLEQGAAREAISFLWERAGREEPHPLRPDLILASGSFFAQSPTLQQVALILLDALQPVGVTTLAVDRMGLLPSLGPLLRTQPALASPILLKDGITLLGTAVTLLGKGRKDRPALSFRVAYPTGEQIGGEVNFGGLEIIPLDPGRVAKVELIPEGGIAVGGGQPGEHFVVEAPGGGMGLIIDARGRSPAG